LLQRYQQHLIVVIPTPSEAEAEESGSQLVGSKRRPLSSVLSQQFVGREYIWLGGCSTPQFLYNNDGFVKVLVGA
jgi:hypothetical protein